VAGDVLDLGTLTVAIPSPDESTLEALDLEFLASNGVDVSAYEDLIEVADPTEATEGEPATVEVGPEFAGQWVTVTINSDPTPAGGWQQVAADGTIVITLPEGVTGSHRLAVADATNQLMGWTPVDIAADVPPDVDPIPAPVYRFWSSTNKSHFYTIDETEKQFVIDTYDDAQWKFEGPAYLAYETAVPGSAPLYRFWSQRYQGHFYTADAGEKDHVIAAYPDDEWKYEGIAYYIVPTTSSVTGTGEVYRFWSQNNRHHFYTSDPVEKQFVIDTYDDAEWAYEGPAFKVPTD